ncbi:MAG: cytochrome d ubiquinol oxidase subunit II [Desulfobacterales bacterium]
MTIETIWFCIWGFLWGMYFATDGFVLGIGVLYLHSGKTDTDRRIMLNSIGPVWGRMRCGYAGHNTMRFADVRCHVHISLHTADADPVQSDHSRRII